MALNNPYQTYLKQSITTSKPEDLTFMLYQGMVKFIRLSKKALQNKNLEESNKNNLKAQDILSELIITLKQDYPVSDSMHSLYEYMKHRLIEANLKKNLDILDEVEGYAVELTEVWSMAMKQNKLNPKV